MIQIGNYRCLCSQAAVFCNLEGWNTCVTAVGSVILPKTAVCKFDFQGIEIHACHCVAPQIPRSNCGSLLFALRSTFGIPLQPAVVKIICVGFGWFVQCVE